MNLRVLSGLCPPLWAYNVPFGFFRSFLTMAQTTQYELHLARRMSRLGTETAFEVLNKARALERQGKSIIHLEIGEPDFDTPANIVEAGVDALRKGWTHYGPSAGLPESAAGHCRVRQPHPRRESSPATKWSSCPAASLLFSSPSWP